MSSGQGVNAIGTVAASRSMIRCPHCLAAAIIRSSEQETPTIKSMRLLCTNEDCGFAWKAQIVPVHWTCPSQVPDPQVHIPPPPQDYQRRHFRQQPGSDPPDPGQATIFEFIDDPPPDQPAASQAA